MSEQFWHDLGWIDETPTIDLDAQRLRIRAEQYARPAQIEDAAADVTVITFDLGAERYAAEVLVVQAVRKAGNVTPVPGAPPFFAGVVNLRGQIITALDLRPLFDLAAEDGPGKFPEEMLVMQSAGLTLGVLAHHVREVRTLARESVQVMDDLSYAYGVTADGVTVLDIPRLFADERIQNR